MRLGIALNLGVMYWELMTAPRKAIATANVALSDALENLSDQQGQRHESSIFLVQMLMKNVALWKADWARQKKAGEAKEEREEKSRERGDVGGFG